MHYHSFDPVILQLGAFRLHWYSLLILFSLLVVWWLARRVAQHHRTEWSLEEVNDLMLYTMIGLLIGSRFGYILFYDLAGLLAKPWVLFQVWQGGMSTHGSLIGAGIACYLFARRGHKDFFQVAELILPLIPIVLLATRMGNFINGELWGRMSELPWSMVFPKADLQPRHPVQLYQAVTEGLMLFGLMWWLLLHKVHRMLLLGAFLTTYGVLDIFTEQFSEPEAHVGYLAGDWLTMGQLLSLAMLLAGLVFIYLTTRAKKGNTAV